MRPSTSRSSGQDRPGLTLAAHLARRGVQVLVLERSPGWHWRAGGVFASPAAVAELRRAGLAETTIDAVTQPIPAMRLETAAGTTVRLTYGADTGGPMAVGFDRSRARPGPGTAGGRCRGDGAARGHRPRRPPPGIAAARTPANAIDLGDRQVAARVVVGADGTHSVVARAAGVARPARLPPRVGLTWHVADPRPTTDPPADARMIVGRDAYVGLARVPGERLNIGVVLGPSWLAGLARDGAAPTVGRLLRHDPSPRRRSRSTGRQHRCATRSLERRRSGSA